MRRSYSKSKKDDVFETWSLNPRIVQWKWILLLNVGEGFFKDSCKIGDE